MVKNRRGISLLNSAVSLALVLLAATGIRLTYVTVQENTIKDLHRYNAIKMVTIVQNGIYEKWVSPPSFDGDESIISLSLIHQHAAIVHLKDPSRHNNDAYDDINSFVKIMKSQGSLQYYVQLRKKESTFVYLEPVKSVNLVTKKDIKLE